VAGRHIVVVDDVVTTGATAEAVARTLLRAGAAAVDVLSFARVTGPVGGEADPSVAEGTFGGLVHSSQKPI
jgi:adenine/guanine phosphoribosyltransferase-like PRPP-binding protein